MAGIKAREALKYAFSEEMLKLYGTLLLADTALLAGIWLLNNWAVRGGTSGLIGQLLGGASMITGFLLGVGGMVAFIYKIVADANNRTD